MVIAFLADLAEGGLESAGSYLTSRSVMASLIRTGLNEGLSGADMLRGFRAAGLGVRTQTFYQLIGQVRSTQNRLQNIGQIIAGGTPEQYEIAKLGGDGTGRYIVNVRSYYKYLDEEGDLIQGHRTTSILQRSGGLTVGKAISDTQTLLSQNAGTTGSLMGQTYGYEVSFIGQYA